MVNDYQKLVENFKVGDEYAWISKNRIEFVTVRAIDKHYKTKEPMFQMVGHTYYFPNDFYPMRDIVSDIKYFKEKVIKIENEQHKLSITLKYA